MSFLGASLARVFSWLPSSVLSEICESTCSHTAVDVVKGAIVEPAILEPTTIYLQPTRVINTVLYQVVSQHETERLSTFPSSNNPLRLIALVLFLVSIVVLAGVCIFAAVRRCKSESNSLIARVEGERGANARKLELALSRHYDYRTQPLQCLSRAVQERDYFRAKCEQLAFTHQWFLMMKADAEKLVHWWLTHLCNAIRELQVQNSLLEAQCADQEEKSSAIVETLRQDNAMLRILQLQELSDWSARNSVLESNIAQLSDHISNLEKHHRLEREASLQLVKELEQRQSTLASNNKELSEKRSAEANTNTAHTRTIENLNKRISKLKHNESKLMKDKEAASEKQVAAELDARAYREEIEDLEERQSNLISRNRELSEQASLQAEATATSLAKIEQLTCECFDLESSNTALFAEQAALTQQLSELEASNTQLAAEKEELLQKSSTLSSKETNFARQSDRLSQQLAGSKKREQVLESEKAISSKEISRLKSINAAVQQEKANLQIDLDIVEAEMMMVSNTNTVLQDSIETLEARSSSAEKQLSSTQVLYSNAKNEMSALRNDLTDKKAKYENNLRHIKEETDQVLRRLEVKCGHEATLNSVISESKAKIQKLEEEQKQSTITIRGFAERENDLSRQLAAAKSNLHLVSSDASRTTIKSSGSNTVAGEGNTEVTQKVVKADRTLKSEFRKEAENLQDLGHRLKQMTNALRKLERKGLLEVDANMASDPLLKNASEELRSNMEIYMNTYLQAKDKILEQRETRMRQLTINLLASAERLLTATAERGEEAIPKLEVVEDIFGGEGGAEDSGEIEEKRSRRRKRRPTKKKVRSSQLQKEEGDVDKTTGNLPDTHAGSQKP